MSHRVAQWSTGNVGRYAIRAILNHPELTLCGVIVSDPKKNGKDVSTVLGWDHPVGVTMTTDVDRVLGDNPDCVSYTAHAETRLFEAIDDHKRVLEAGINLVGSSLVMFTCAEGGDMAPLAQGINEAAISGGATAMVNGIDPGFANDLMPLVFSGLSLHWEQIKCQEVIDYSLYRQAHTIREVMGFGYPMDHECIFMAEGAVAMGWGGAVRSIAAGVGVELDRIYQVMEKLPLDADTENDMGLFKKGTLGAIRFEVRGEKDGRDVIIEEHVTRITPDIAPDWPQGKGYRAYIKGEPDMTIMMDMVDRHGDHGEAGTMQTATKLINAIPAIIAHAPGFIPAARLPLITGKGLYRPDGEQVRTA